MNLTLREKQAIAALEKLAKRWPKTLWLFSASGSLEVHKYSPLGERRILLGGGIDPDGCVVTIYGIDSDGGDY